QEPDAALEGRALRRRDRPALGLHPRECVREIESRSIYPYLLRAPSRARSNRTLPIPIANRVLICNRVAGFIIVGGQDNVQMVAGRMLGFSAELGFIFPQFPFIAHSRGWSPKDMENNVAKERNSKELADGACMLAKRLLDLAARLTAQDEAPASIER